MRTRLELYNNNQFVFTIHCNREIPLDFQTQDCIYSSGYLAIAEQGENPLMRDILRVPAVTSVQIDRYAIHVAIGKAFGRRTRVRAQNNVIQILTLHLAKEGERVKERKTALLTPITPANIEALF